MPEPGIAERIAERVYNRPTGGWSWYDMRKIDDIANIVREELEKENNPTDLIEKLIAVLRKSGVKANITLEARRG